MAAILDSANLYKRNFTHWFWLNVMMATILKSAILDSSFLQKKNSLVHSDLSWWRQPSWILPLWIQPFCIKKIFTHSFWLNLMMAAILKSAILDSAIIVFPLKLTHTCQDWFPPFAQKTFTHSFWLKLMMAAILNSAMLDLDPAILDSYTLFSSLRFTQKHSLSILTLTQTNSNGLKLIHSHLNWWWQQSWILPICFQPS